MTDANGTRNIRNGSQNPGSANSNGITTTGNAQNTNRQPSQGGANASGDFRNGRFAIERPKLNISSSPYLSKSIASGDASPENGITSSKAPSSRDLRGNVSHNLGAGERPNSRHRAKEERTTTRRRRNQSRNHNDERRRLFGTVPDRIKRKSSSRTRALKAKTATPSTRHKDRQKKPSTSATPLTQKTAGKSATSPDGRNRPPLPNSAYPGRVPPSRGLARKRRRVSKNYTMLRRGVQLLIVGVGLAAIGGTLLKVLPDTPEPTLTETVETPLTPPAKSFPVSLTQEIPALKSSLQELPNLYPSLTPKVFYVDVDTGHYVSVEGTETVAAASTIKLPILLAFFEEVDAGRIDPNQTMAIQPEQIAEGSGDMQLSAPGTQFTALEVATQMIISSDNTATNMMIDLLGGNEILNARFRAQGLEKTVLNAPLPDLEGTNTTSARDLVNTMLLISEEDELTMRSRDRILNILNRTRNKSLLANGPIEQDALTYNKTGDIGSVLGDVALVDLPNGKRYAIAALVERPTNDGRAQELIRRISGQTYQEAAKAVQRTVTPLSTTDGTNAGSGASAQSSENGSAATGTNTAPASDPAAQEEAPYPNANPQN